MSTSLVVALIVSCGAAVWVYVKMMKSTGNNNKTSLIISGITFVIGFIVLLEVFKKYLKS